MVLHVGLDIREGYLKIYDSVSKNTLPLESISKVFEDEHQNVNPMFEQIKAKLDGSLGCLCIALNCNYWDEFRNSLIENGLKAGFEKIEFIDADVAGYYDVISQTNFKPKNGDFIGIFEGGVVHFVKQNVQNARHLGFRGYNVKRMQKLKEEIKEEINENINVVFYSDTKLNETLIKTNIPNCQVFSFSGYTSMLCCDAFGALVKARMMAGDDAMAQYIVKE